jgi:excinuclease ABC subunit C
MEEVLTRRMERYKAEKDEEAENRKKFSKLPDIILVDGGKPQISAAEGVLAKLGYGIPVCGMVKDERHRTKGLLYNNEEIPLPKHSEGFKLLTRIQDEVHRFAIEYHKLLRQKASIHSVLDDIPGIGQVRRTNLVKHFGSVDKIRAATAEELLEVESMNKKTAKIVWEFFNENKA